ncbi:MAG: CBS domain-containing protein [Candidatus Methanomethyliales bacterium]|nr:CBS domain-containing protein [Candidatus Methanomethylicales archaeon]
MKISEFVSSNFAAKVNDPLIKAASLIGGGKGRYRLVVTDDDGTVRGVISGRRILEVLIGRRATSVIEEKGLDLTLNEPVNLFMDEAHQIFLEDVNLETVLKYIGENMAGYVILVDQSGRFKGIVEEIGFLERLKGKKIGIRVEEIMSVRLHTENIGATVCDASIRMVNERVRRLPILEGGKVVGLITISDILKQLASAKEAGIEAAVYDIFNRKVEEVMTKKIVGVEPDADVGEAVKSLLEMDVSGLLVFRREDLVGIVSRIDIVGKTARIKGIEQMVEMML